MKMTKEQIRNRIAELNQQSIELMGWKKFNKIQRTYLNMFNLEMCSCYKTYTKEVHNKYLQVALLVNDCCF